jgi:pimeloyl-ACP methyl ester carboxylesterase
VSALVPEAWSRKETGLYQAGEMQVEVWPNGEGAAGKIPIIFCTGFSLLAQPAAIVTGEPYPQRLGYIAERTGCPVVCADLGGNLWANTTARTRFSTLRTWLGANRGLRTDKFFVAGESMGSILALLMAWTNPVACVGYWVRAPIVAVETFHDANPGGLAASMEAAYTNLAGLVAAYPTIDPNVAANRLALATFGQRGRIDWTDEDDFIAPTIPQTYAPQVGAIGVQRHGDHDANLRTPVEPIADWIASVIEAAA